MRRLLLAFMIVLLPLRGLVGDAMALSMVEMPAHESTQVADQHGMPCPAHASAAPTPHHEQMVAGSSADSADPATDTEHAHNACDLCNGPALTRPTTQQPLLPTVHGVRAGAVERFASSEPQRGSKPPIS